MRNPLLTAAIILGSLFAGAQHAAVFVAADQPQVPPGTQPAPLVAPVIVPPKLADDPAPEPDPLKVPFGIVAKIRGELQGDIIALPVGQLLELTLEGDAIKPNEEGKVPAAFWAFNKLIPDKAQPERYRGHYFLMTGEVPETYLLTVSVNNPDPLEAPLVASRWVVVGGVGPRPPPVVVDPVKPTVPSTPTTKATAAVYVYEKDVAPIPPGVLSGINRLNRELKIVATTFEDDVTNGLDQVPEQYKVPAETARATGGAALIVLAGSTVLNTVKVPTTEEQVMGAVQ